MKLSEYELSTFTYMAEANYDIYMRQHVLPRDDDECGPLFYIWDNYDCLFAMYISKFIGYNYYSSASDVSGIYSEIPPTKESVKEWFENLPEKAPSTHEEKRRKEEFEDTFSVANHGFNLK